MWFNIVKIEKPRWPREHKTYEGNRPHFYQFLKRAFRNASEQTPQYRKKYYGWDELEDVVKAGIKKIFDKHHPENHPDWPEKTSRWGGNNPIPGIKIDWNGLNPTLDEDYYNEWRASTKGAHSNRLSFGSGRYEQDHLYRVISQLLARNEETSTWAERMYLNL